ncbi:hypothetical protein MRX96_035302 [Rhipicephalus microplus]
MKQRKQQEGESIEKYISHLRRLAKNCNFGDFPNWMLRDRIVCNIRDDDAHRCLLTHKKLSVEETEEFATASKKTLNDVRYMREGLSEMSVSRTNVCSHRDVLQPPRGGAALDTAGQ